MQEKHQNLQRKALVQMLKHQKKCAEAKREIAQQKAPTVQKAKKLSEQKKVSQIG